MNSFRSLILIVAIFIIMPATKSLAARDPNVDATLVVYNSIDPISTLLARLYALKRDIPDDQVIGLECSIEEEISPDEYEKTIARPLRELFTKKNWWKLARSKEGYYVAKENRIRFVALIRGMPLKINSGILIPMGGPTPPPMKSAAPTPTPIPVPPPKPMERKEASVDTQLACLGIRGIPAEGPINNPYFRSFKMITDADLGMIMLVTRLDGPDAESVRNMIKDSLEVEKTGIGGIAYLDARNIKSGGYAQGDKWMDTIAKDTRTRGIPTILDRAPSTYPKGYPMAETGLYYGWYTTNVDGPFADDRFKFRKGAIAVHIHSFSAATVRNGLRYWVGPLLKRGATATLGNVYEPYLDLTPHLDVFNNRLLNGFTFAESAYMSLKGLSWMTTIIGDPLYRPFATMNDFDPKPPSAEMMLWSDYRTLSLKQKNDKKPDPTALKAMSSKHKTGIFFEGLAHAQLAEGNETAAWKSLASAREFYPDVSDQIRTRIHEVRHIQITKGKPTALKRVSELISNYPPAPTAPESKPTASTALMVIKKELTPPPPTPTPVPPGQKAATASTKKTSKKAEPTVRKAIPVRKATPVRRNPNR